MKLITAALVAASQFIAPALGHDGFFVYGGTSQTLAKHVYKVWGMYPSVPTCEMVDTLPGYFGENDVSKRKGVVCDGDGCVQTHRDPTDIWRVEMNVDFGHYTWYRGPAQELVDLEGRVVGHCFEQHEKFESAKVDCKYQKPKGEQKINLNPYLWCDTKVWA
ncbi:hypothetical protein QBC39DRAFT_383087 [Podospora conica]|nr:hypothetical protein QBC39DRAFT_383087 [Schizothecium conicum]